MAVSLETNLSEGGQENTTAKMAQSACYNNLHITEAVIYSAWRGAEKRQAGKWEKERLNMLTRIIRKIRILFMITDTDIKKLVKEFKKVFATKEDLKRFATKDDLNRFATKEDFGFLSKKINDLGEKMDKIYLNLAQEVGNILKESQEIKDEMKYHSKKIKKLETARLN